MILFWERWNGPETWRHAPATAGLLVVACAATAGPAPAATPAAEGARATALLNRRASFIVSSPGTGRRPCPGAAVTPVILHHHNPSETEGFHRKPPPRGPSPGAAPIMLDGALGPAGFRCGEFCRPPRATGRAAGRL